MVAPQPVSSQVAECVVLSPQHTAIKCCTPPPPPSVDALRATSPTLQEESIATATIEARQAAQRAKEEAERGLTTTRSGPSASHLYGKPSPYDLYETGVEGLSLQEEGQGRLLRPAPLGPAASGSKDGTAAEGGEGGCWHGFRSLLFVAASLCQLYTLHVHQAGSLGVRV
jgi:hypothetical protein